MSDTPPKCLNPNCSNFTTLLSRPAGKYKQYCSRACQNKCNSINGSEKRKSTCVERYGATSNLTHSDTIKKSKLTSIDRYGTDHPMKSSVIKQKLKTTKYKRYGDESFNNREKFKETLSHFSDEKQLDIQQRRSTTVNEKYGVDFVTQSAEVKRKSEATSLATYGTTNPAKSDIVKSKIRLTQQQKFGSHYNQQHISSDSLSKLSDISFLDSKKNETLTRIAHELGVTYHTVAYAYRKFNIDKPVTEYNTSVGETEITDFVKSLGVDCSKNRTILNRKEIDIFIPAKNIGIEYNGIFWHSENAGKNKSYHSDKMLECNEKGVRLIQIWDTEWKSSPDIVKSRIRNLLGKSDKIYARKCKIVELSKSESSQFFSVAHIQGSCVDSVRYGLIFNGELVAAMSFGKSRFNKSFSWELLRFANKLNVSVTGGASKLFSHFVKLHQPASMVSYCDLRWNTGKVYENLGFKLARITTPNYWYTKHYATLDSRIAYQKHKLATVLPIFNADKTEWENMKANSFDRVWDCGNKVFVWNASA